MKVLTEILEKNSTKFANNPALTMKIGYRTFTWNYAQVYDFAKKIALFLEKEGIGKGDNVLILAHNSPYWVCTFWAIMLRGAVAVPLNIQSTSKMVQKIADQTDAKIIFKSRSFRTQLPDDIKSFDIEFLDELTENLDVNDFKKTDVQESDLVEILYTSGTTGDPKGVLLTHKNICSNLKAISQVFTLSEGKERLLSILPLTHIYEQTAGFFLTFSSGSHIIYTHSYAAIIDLMQKYKITKMLSVPEFLKVLMSKIKAAAEKNGKLKLFEKMLKLSLRVNNKFFSRLLFYKIHKQFGGKLDMIACGGAFLPPVLEKEWNAIGITLLQGYGLTETSPVISSNIYKNPKLGSVGKIIKNVDVKITDDGEIWVKGPSVFSGYYKNEEKTKESFSADGYFKTGDMGEIDKDGFLFLKGRKKYMIVGPGAQNIYPEDIEFELNNLSAVKDSCVLGLETESGMIEIHAVLLLEKDVKNVEKIIEQANSKLATYQHITGWSVWPEDDFPRSATRKVKKEEVRKLLEIEKKNEPTKKVKKDGQVVQILSQISGVDINIINDETKVVPELKLDSLMLVELVVRIEQDFRKVIDETLITPKTTVKQLKEIISKKEAAKKMPPLKKWPGWLLIRILRVFGQYLVFGIARIFVKLKVEGIENLKNLKLPAIFMPNHLSYIDPIVVCWALPFKIRRRISFASGRDVLYDYYWYLSGLAEFLVYAFPLPRQEGENIKLGLTYMGQLLDKNYSAVVFPEGQMSETGEFLPLKRGAGFVAVEMNSYIVPVKIYGSAHVLPYAKFMPRHRGEVRVIFGKPMRFKKTDSYDFATNKIEEEIKKL